MKKFYLFLFFASSLFSGFSQTQITLTFIGKDSLTQNLISLDSVFVKNLTENCDTTLYDAVSILYLDAFWPVGIGENNISSSGSFVLKQNYPNPFQGSTFVNIYREYGGSLNLILFDELGTKLATYQNDFVKGFHSFVVSSSGNKVLFLVVFDDKNNRSIKIISTGQSNETNSIRYLGYSPNVDKGSLKILDNSGFIFYLGNELMYTAYVNGYNDKTITDSPITNTNYTLLMAPAGTPPSVTTTSVTNITQTTATSGGNVTADGGATVTARGVCWSISPSPTIAGNHTTDGTGVGAFVSNITGLTGGTIYYIRSYATNIVGTAYGNELSFTTLENWVVQNSGTIYDLQSVYFTDANTGYAVGLLGTILKTTNGGTNWTPQTSGTLENLHSVYFPNATTGYAVGTSGAILKTTNGGTNWTPQTSGTSDSLMSVHFPDVNTGYIAGGFGFILKTTNGGTSWIQKPTIPLMGSAVYFTNASTGYTIGWTGNSGPIIKTIDGGTNWTTQFSGSTEELFSVHFPTVDSGFVVGGGGMILRTSNGGTNWTPQTSGTLENLYSVYFPNVTIGYVVGTSGAILKTTNGGTTWTNQTSGTTNNLNSVHFIGVNIGYAVGDNGTILKTTDGGG